MLYIGCHVSSSNGFAAMGKTALSLGANTFQYFSRNPRGGNVRPFDPDDASALITLMQENSFGPIVTHAPYTINPCAADPNTIDFARRALKEDIQRLEFFPGALYNLHPGSHVRQGVEKGIELISESLNSSMFPGMHTMVLLETMAGKGTEVGSRFEEIRAIMERITVNDRIGVCLDTCHIYDAGYDVVGNTEAVLEEFDRVIGIRHLHAIHINDSKNPMSSHKDRHEKIGLGSIGTETFVKLLTHPNLKHLPFILETPNEDAGYKAEIELLRSLT